MPSTYLFLAATLLLSLNFVRVLGLAVSDWLYLGALGFALVETVWLEPRQLSCWWRNRFLGPAALILFGAILSTMNARYWDVALVEVLQQAFVVTLFISLTWIMVRRGKGRQVIMAFILSGAFTAGIALLDALTASRLGPTLSRTPNLVLWGRFAGSLGHPNKQGYYLVLTALLSLSQWPALRAARFALPTKVLWGLLLLIQLAGIYLSGSMMAFLGLLLGTGAILLASGGRLLRRTGLLARSLLAGTFTVALMIVFNIALVMPSIDWMNTSVAQAFNRVRSSTAHSRLEVYAQAWEQISRSPWLGIGYDQISTSGLTSGSRYLDFGVHNSLLQIWYTGGFFAFLGWVLLYGMVAWMALKILFRSGRIPTSLEALACAAAGLAIVMMDQFQDGIYQREKWLVIGLLAAWYWGRGTIEAVSVPLATED